MKSENKPIYTGLGRLSLMSAIYANIHCEKYKNDAAIEQKIICRAPVASNSLIIPMTVVSQSHADPGKRRINIVARRF
jgi:hypothetical protein